MATQTNRAIVDGVVREARAERRTKRKAKKA
jgi:hypothetical protein